MRSRLKNLGKNLVVVFISLLFTLALLEGAARILKLGTGGFWEPDNELGWRNIPGAKGWESCYGECQVQVTINSQGLRDREIPYEKEENVRRILMLGDSTTAGMQVTLAETFVKQLEAQLNDSGNGDWEVLNAGVNAYGTDNELLFYRMEGAKYTPDIVFLNMYLANDIYNNQRQLELRFGGQSHKPYFELNDDGELELNNFPVEDAETFWTGVGSFLKKHFQLPRFVAQTLNLRGEVPAWLRPVVSLFGGARGAPAADREPADNSDQATVTEGTEATAWRRPDICDTEYVPLVDEAWDITKALILQLRTEVEANGSQLAVLVIPAAPQIVPPEGDEAWYCNQPNDELTGFLEAEGIPYLDMLPAFRDHAQAGSDPLYFERDFHMTAGGHAVAGELLYKFVHEEWLLDAN